MIATTLGSALIVLGTGLAVWTHTVLGWRRLLWLTDDPPSPARARLVFRGPYQFTRHPAFLALLMIMAGVALVCGEGVAWAVFAVALAVLPMLARQEERRLAGRFGEAYCRYQRAVPFLLPRRRSAPHGS